MPSGKDRSPFPFGSHPPRPVLTLRVGVSGHRPKPEKFPETSFEFVGRRLATVFEAIDACLENLHVRNNEYYSPGAHKVRLVSGLAEGADQLAVEMRPVAWDLDAVLPLPLENYRLDFRQSATGRQIDAVGQFEASLCAATTVLQLPDDPCMTPCKPAQGHSAAEFSKNRSDAYVRDIDFFTRQFDILIGVWDGAAEDGPGGTAEVIRRALEANIPVVWISSQADTFPRLVKGVDEDGRAVAPPVDCLRGPLQEAIETIVSAPFEQSRFDAGPELSAERRLATFLSETWPPLADATENEKASWAKFIDDAPAAGKLEDRLLAILLPRVAWADALAVNQAQRLRSAFKARWRQRRAGYRTLAAILRNLRFLAYFGECGCLRRPDDLEPSSSAWLLWYVCATIREIGLPNALLDGAYQRALLAAVENNVIGDHIAGLAQRSSKTVAELQELTQEFDAAKRRLRLDTSGAVLVSAARVLTADLAAWQALYGQKR